jgi:hypothetical protein
LLQYYAGPSYHRIDGSLSPAEVSQQIQNLLEEIVPLPV